MPDAEKFPDTILSIINGKQKGLMIQLTQEQAEILRKRTGTLLLSGEAGSGKTTIIDMIVGLLRPTEGEIYYGHTNQRKIDITSLRKKI